jgi:hypothetical protein
MALAAAVNGGFFVEAQETKVFNTTVDNSVEKLGSIVVSDSAGNVSAFCTGASAGTLVPLNAEMAVLEVSDPRASLP